MVPASAPGIGLRPSERTPSSCRRSPSFLPLVRGWLTHAKGTAMDDVARVILAIGSQEVAEEVLHLLDRSGRARVVATAADDRQLAEAVRQLEPDAVVAEQEVRTMADLIPVGDELTVEHLDGIRVHHDAGFDVVLGCEASMVDAVEEGLLRTAVGLAAAS